LPARLNELVSVLKNDDFSANPETKENEPVIDLKKEDVREKFEETPREPLRILAILLP